tara:strand:+ start:422 stop:718 length:297 start_codon:yes stop_codon:yes gene_type:complete
MMKRQTRNHPGLVWEGENLHNNFTDINRIALDDKYGKVAAPLTKRKNGSGPAGRNAPAGLFGNPSLTKLENTIKSHLTPPNIILGVAIAGAILHYYKK